MTYIANHISCKIHFALNIYLSKDFFFRAQKDKKDLVQKDIGSEQLTR